MMGATHHLHRKYSTKKTLLRNMASVERKKRGLPNPLLQPTYFTVGGSYRIESIAQKNAIAQSGQ